MHARFEHGVSVEATITNMAVNLYGDSLKLILNRLVETCGWTAYRLAEVSGVDRGNLHRLLFGEKKNPGIKTMLKLCMAFCRSPNPPSPCELDELLIASGHPPLLADGDADRAA
jgi:hypothetical protein